MTVPCHAQKELRQVVVPVRFERAVGGRPQSDAPDLDDRGWVAPRAAGLNSTSARGPLFGLRVGETVRVRVVREDIDGSAPLHATPSESPDPQFRVVIPEEGEPIGPDGIVELHGVKDSSTGQALEIRLGSPSGPVVGEAEPHVFDELTLEVTPHVVAIHTAANARASSGLGTYPTSQGELHELFDVARAVWAAAGVRLEVGSARQEDVYGGALAADCMWVRANASNPSDLVNVARLDWVPDTLNAYFVCFIEDRLGIGLHRGTMGSVGSPNPAIFVAIHGHFSANGAGTALTHVWNRPDGGADRTQALGNDLAHGIGHFLGLAHADDVNDPGRDDTYARRQLMHPRNPLPSGGAGHAIRRTDVGYGTSGGRGHRGGLLTLKEYPDAIHRTDGEVMTARNRFQPPGPY